MKKYISADHILLAVFVVLWTLLVWGEVEDWSNDAGWIPRLFSLAWIVLLTFWLFSGFNTIPIAHKGQLLFLGRRMDFFFEEEGFHWAPYPFSVKIQDCKEQIMELDTLEAITSDNVKVFINTTITYKVVDLHQRSNVNDAEVKRGLDDVRDQILRVEVASNPLDDVLKMHSDLGKKMHEGLQLSTKRWGIKIIEVIITKVVTDPKVAEDLESKAREELQRKGQFVEAQWQTDLIAFYMKPDIKTGFPGLTKEQAVEQAQLTIGQAKKNIFGVDATAAEIIASILKGR